MNNSTEHISHSSYAILDAARILGELDIAQTLQPNFLSLYFGESEKSLSSIAPYLFDYQNESEFAKWLFENGCGNSWGIFVETNIIMEDLRKHLRKFLIVQTEEGKEMYFRFYDPRVLKIFLPTCDKNQILEFFGPIESFICEGDTKQEAIRFWQENGELKQEILPAEKIFGEIKTTVLIN